MHAARTVVRCLPELSAHEDSFSARLDENVEQKVRLGARRGRDRDGR